MRSSADIETLILQNSEPKFLASESAANPADAPKLAQAYDVAFNGALATQSNDYCSERIKLALTRHLRGDYTPSPPEPSEADGGLFSGWNKASSSSNYQSAGDKLHAMVGGQVTP